MTQILALLTDSYRELNSRKLFWITMLLSGLVVGVFAAFGLNDKGISFLWWSFDTPLLSAKTIEPRKFYIFAFANLGIPIWLTWAAMILALISTSSIFPDFIAGGAIELTLSKPISRMRLFLVKYVLGLLFVVLQVGVFTLACFLVIGVRGESWEPSLFLAVPIVTLVFSYLFGVCVLVGMMTRSTIAALLATLLFWLFLWGLNTTDGIFVLQRETSIVNLERAQKRVERQELASRRRIEQLAAAGEPVPTADTLPANVRDELEAVNAFLAPARKEVTDAEESAAFWKRWTRLIVGAKTVLPKTVDTTALLDRWLLTPEDKALFSPERGESGDPDGKVRFGQPDREVQKRAEEAVRGRTVFWVIGTSLGFEALVVLLAGWLFCRRDF